jgi:hypothetical protein
MANLASLTDSLNDMYLQDMNLEEQQRSGEQQIDFHELKMEYPVLDLLPVDEPVTPFLRPPAYTGYREEPNAGSYHLPLFGNDFIIRRPCSSDQTASLPYLDPHNLFDSLERLVDAPGRTLLQIATYTDHEDGNTYRFRLRTEHCNQRAVVMNFELSGIEWEAERCARPREIWMKMIWRLLRRASDRAYFHVHERLKSYSWYKKQAAKEEWDWKARFNAKQFITMNLRLVVGALWDPCYDRPIEDSDFQEGWRERNFLLPCGHEQIMHVRGLEQMSVNKCLRLECEDCGSRVVQHDEVWRVWLLLHRDRERRTRFSAREWIWEQLTEEENGEDKTRQVKVHPTALYKALKHALISVIPPESASPLVLHMTKSPNFVKALRIFQEMLEGETEVTCFWIDILPELLNNLDRAVGQAGGSGRESGNLQQLPSGWVALIDLWLRRAALLVEIPGYDGADPTVIMGERAIEEEDVSYDDDELDELAVLMGDARLE